MIYPHQRNRKLFDDRDVYEITVSSGRYDEAIDQALDDNKIEDSYSNPQEGDAEFNRYDDPIQASIADLIAYFDGKLLKIAVNE